MVIAILYYFLPQNKVWWILTVHVSCRIEFIINKVQDFSEFTLPRCQLWLTIMFTCKFNDDLGAKYVPPSQIKKLLFFIKAINIAKKCLH